MISVDMNNNTELPLCLEAMHQKLLANLAPSSSVNGHAFPLLDDDRQLPFQLGRFQLLERLGAGGQGTVFRANDPAKATMVAIKLLNTSGPIWDVSLRARFRREAQLASRIDHPNVASVLEAGQFEGVAYLVMPYCPGPTLAKWMQNRGDGPLPPTEAARFIRELANAVAACHARGVLHRDLKPGNVLLFLNSPETPSDAPLSAFTPRISDFGLSRAEDDGESLTKTDVILGTRGYMSPEQATGKWKDVGVASDVWSLGIMLYELLTAEKPFGDDWQTVVRLQNDFVMIPPRRLNAGIPHDLEAITLKCLSKTIENRYSTTQSLSEDLSRFLNNESTHARPLGQLKRSYRWLHRRPLVVLSILISLVMLGLASLGIMFHLLSLEEHNIKLKDALNASQRAELEARRHIYDSEIRRCAVLLQNGDEPALYSRLQGLSPGPGQADLRDFTWRYLSWRLGGNRYTTPTFCATQSVAYAPDGSFFASLSMRGQVRLWDSKTAKLLGELPKPDSPAIQDFYSPRVLISPQQRWLVANYVAGHSTVPKYTIEHACWDLQQPQLPPRILSTKSEQDAVKGMQFSRDGTLAFLVKQRRVQQYTEAYILELLTIDMENWSVIRSQPLPGNLHRDICLDPDGKTWWILTASAEKPIDQTVVDFFLTHTDPVVSGASDVQRLPVKENCLWADAAYEPIHQRLAFEHVTNDGVSIVLYDIKQKKTFWSQPWTKGKRVVSTFLKFDETGEELIAAKGEHSEENSQLTACCWQVATGKPVLVYPRSTSPDRNMSVVHMVRHPTLSEYAIARQDGIVHIQPKSLPPAFLKLSPDKKLKEIWAFALDSNGQLIAGGDHGYCCIWDIKKREAQTNMPHGFSLISSMLTIPDSTNSLLTADYGGVVRLWNTDDGKLTRSWSVSPGLKLRALAASTDGRWVVAGGKSPQLWIWDRQLNKTLLRDSGHLDSIRALCFLNDQLFSSGEGGTLRANEIGTGKTLWNQHAADELWCMDVTSDNQQLLVTGNKQGDLDWYDAATGLRRRSVSKAHPGGIQTLTISPDNKTIATGGEDHLVKLWNLATGEELLTLSGHTKAVHAVAFSPDGQTLISGGHDGQILIWPAPAK